MKPDRPPEPTYAFGYRAQPRSGNVINGLGSRDKVQASKVFHFVDGRDRPWRALDDFFSLINVWGVVRHMIANAWQLRRQGGPARPRRITVADPDAMAAEIKEKARQLGAGLVGVTRMFDGALYAGHETPYENAICIGLPMDREEMVHVPQERAAMEVMRTYRKVAQIAVRLSEHIRAMGWPARAYGNPNSTDILQIPLAIQAGLGQLGKHGSMISREYGSNFRLAAVLTDLPMAMDEPADIGVDDLCQVCQRCVIDCPPDAIFNVKQMVRGESKWYVDFDKCIYYFVKTLGCAICIEVCPWSEPGRGDWLSRKLLAGRK